MLRGIIATIALLFAVTTLTAQSNESKVIACDTINYSYTPFEYIYTPIDQSNGCDYGSGQSFLDLLPAEEKSLEIIVLPTYTIETSLCLVFSSQFAIKEFSISAVAMASIIGYYNISLSGKNNIGNDHTLTYGAKILSEPTRLWGLNFDSASNDNFTSYTGKEYSAWLQYKWQFVPKTTLGINADYAYHDALKLDTAAQEILTNKPLSLSVASIGIDLSYDSRHKPEIYQQRGIYAKAEATYRPRFLNSLKYDMYVVGLTFDWYQPLWAGATLAFDIFGKHTSNNTPWMLQNLLGDNCRMRGYYPGRFRGNTLLTTQLELRQHIWKGIGLVAWGGAGTTLSPNDNFAWRKILPTYGGGIRYYHKYFTVRADVGFGRNSFNIMVGLSEAF